MKVFISYSREDSALVHLLDYVLRKNDIICTYDRKLLPGQEFSKEIQEMIEKADTMVVPWTENASNSNWVNQEIGFAVGLKKTIIPIGIEKDEFPNGMLSSIQSYALFDYDNSEKTVDGLIKAIKSVKSSSANNFYFEKNLDLDFAIDGREQRTSFVIETLKDLCELDNEFTVYCQAALSAFSVSKDEADVYERISGHSRTYMKLLLEEREQFERLLEKRNVEMRIILWPIRKYNKQLLELRYKTLLGWMEEKIKNPPRAKVDFVCAKYIGQNRLIISNSPKQDMLFEGIKRKSTPGYGVNILSRKRDKINTAISDFESVYQAACLNNLQGKGAINEIERIRKAYLNER